jgi:hypothetical protein
MREAKAEAELLVAWAREVLPEIQGGYAFGTDEKPEALPDVQVELLNRRIASEDPVFPFAQLQQEWLQIFEFGISFMVDNTNPELADEQLKDFSDRLLAAALNDGTLGSRVDLISPLISFDYTPPFVEYPSDGTKGREMTMQIITAERLGPPE